MKLRHLTRLEISGTPLSEKIEYRQEIFKTFLLLEICSGLNREGEEVDESEDFSYSESEKHSENSDENYKNIFVEDTKKTHENLEPESKNKKKS